MDGGGSSGVDGFPSLSSLWHILFTRWNLIALICWFSLRFHLHSYFISRARSSSGISLPHPHLVSASECFKCATDLFYYFFIWAKHNYINVTKTFSWGRAEQIAKEDIWLKVVLSHSFFPFCICVLIVCARASCAVQRMYTPKVKKCWTSPHISWIPNCHIQNEAHWDTKQQQTKWKLQVK